MNIPTQTGTFASVQAKTLPQRVADVLGEMDPRRRQQAQECMTRKVFECTNGLSVLKVVMTLAAARTRALILNLLNEGTSFHVQHRPPIQVDS